MFGGESAVVGPEGTPMWGRQGISAVDGGVPVRQVAALLRVSVSYIYKASLPCGRPPRKLAGHEQALLMRLGAEPDATLAELRDWLAAERGVTVSLGCPWRTLDRLGLRLKKSRFVPPSRTGRTWRRPARLGATARGL